MYLSLQQTRARGAEIAKKREKDSLRALEIAPLSSCNGVIMLKFSKLTYRSKTPDTRKQNIPT